MLHSGGPLKRSDGSYMQSHSCQISLERDCNVPAVKALERDTIAESMIGGVQLLERRLRAAGIIDKVEGSWPAFRLLAREG